MATKGFTGSSSSSSSSSRSSWTHDVFLSFRGPDTRWKFTDHLYAALIREGIQTFRDAEELPRGNDISSELPKAIRESQIAVIVFSKDYASSRWCLDELAEILECKNKIDQIVIPIFYDVLPSDVRNQKGSFAEAFERHEEMYKDDIGRVKKWREALSVVANSSGLEFHNKAYEYEAKFIQMIVEEVLRKLDCKHLDVASHPVGIDSRVNDVITSLRIRTNNVRIVGMHGMGGIGKTTTAKAVFNQLCNSFEGSCFLSNVKDASKQHNGLVQLQEQLLQDILKTKNLKIKNVDSGINLLKKRLGSKRVLLVVDDLDQPNQLNALVGGRYWFGLGSRIIVTTRDKHLLTQLEVDEKYEVKELNRDESLQLFNWHAFRETSPKDEFVKLSSDVVSYAGGLPLALEVLGSFLFDRTIEVWRSAIEKLKEVPDAKIQQTLQISYDSLDDDKVKDIFLYVACFFIGYNKQYVAAILDGCGLYSQIGIEILIGRSLLKIEVGNKLAMHDLLRDMAREIIRKQSPDHPGKRSRLWSRDEVLDVLKGKTGTKAVKGLILDVGASEDTFISTESFVEMTSLRLLQINAVHLIGRCKDVFKELRWLCWHKCPHKYLSLDLQLDNLIVLDMTNSNIREVPKMTKSLNKLKILNLCDCIYLVKTPNFSGLCSLEKLVLDGCISLVEIHQSIGELERLVFLNLAGCTTLEDLPETICHLKSLKTFNVSGCSKISKFPMHLGEMEALNEIMVDGTSIWELPSSIGHLMNLETFSLSGKSFVRSSVSPRSSKYHSKGLLPASFSSLSSLKKLNLGYIGLSDADISLVDFGGLSSLQKLDLEGSEFCKLPNGIANLSKLHKLLLSGCKNLISISEVPPNLWWLGANDCLSMERLSLQSKQMLWLSLSGCQNLVEIQGLENKENMMFLNMEGCNNLAEAFKNKLIQVLPKIVQKGDNDGSNVHDLYMFWKNHPELVIGQDWTGQGSPAEIVLPYSEILDWFNYQRDGSSLSFYVPEGVIIGVMIMAVFASPEWINQKDCWLFDAFIRNRSNKIVGWQVGFCDWKPFLRDHSWIIYMPRDFALKSGEELELSIEVLADVIITVKKCGVYFIMDSQRAAVPYITNSSSSNENLGAKRVRDNGEAELGGDLSIIKKGCSKRHRMGPDV